MISRVSLLLLVAGLMIGITCAVVAVNWGPSNPAPPPLEFDVVVGKLKDIPFHATREEVEALLGPATDRISGFEFAEEEQLAELRNRHTPIPDDRYWLRWSDAKNDERYVAILFAGHYPKYNVYLKIKRGF